MEELSFYDIGDKFCLGLASATLGSVALTTAAASFHV